MIVRLKIVKAEIVRIEGNATEDNAEEHNLLLLHSLIRRESRLENAKAEVILAEYS